MKEFFRMDIYTVGVGKYSQKVTDAVWVKDFIFKENKMVQVKITGQMGQRIKGHSIKEDLMELENKCGKMVTSI